MGRKDNFEFSNVSLNDFLDTKGIILGQTRRKKNKKWKKIDPRKSSSKPLTLERKRGRENKYLCEICNGFRQYCYCTLEEYPDEYFDSDDDDDNYVYYSHIFAYGWISVCTVENNQYLRNRELIAKKKKIKYVDQLEFIPPLAYSRSSLELLPLEILNVIYSYCSVQDRYALSCTSKYMKDAITGTNLDVKVNIIMCPIDVCGMRVIYQMERERKNRESYCYKSFKNKNLYKNMLLLALRNNNTKIAKWSNTHLFDKDLDKSLIETLYQVAHDSNTKAGKTPSIIKHIKYRDSSHNYIKYNYEDIVNDDILYMSDNETISLLSTCIQYNRTGIFDILMNKLIPRHLQCTMPLYIKRKMKTIIDTILPAILKYDNLNFILKFVQYIEPEDIALKCANPDIDALTIFKWLWGYYKLYNDKKFLNRFRDIYPKAERIYSFVAKMVHH